jgi:transcriptional regulator with XRE-family HTH domain
MSARDLGNQVKRLRESRDLTQQALADKAGVNRVTVANIERGDAEPTLATLQALAKALGVPVTTLLK